MATLDSKKNGRFIKRGDPLVKVLSISDFNLSEICETPLTYHDNASSNIIHQRLHLSEDLEESVRLSSEIETVFPSSEERMIIRPLDFTDEWARMRKRQSSRVQRTDDDEDFDLESSRSTSSEPETVAEEKPEEFGPGGLMDLPQAPAPTPTPIPPPKPEVFEAKSTKLSTPAPVDMSAEETVHEDDLNQDSNESEEVEEAEEEGDFVPYAKSQNRGPKVSPLERYPTEEELEAIREAARQEGFRQGFQTGEERATIEARSKVQAIMEEVGHIVENLEGMQSAILKSAQENFHTIAQNLVESLLHKEFQLNPQSFGTIIERAISESLSEDEFKIFVSPSIAKDLKGWSNQALVSRLKSDDTLKDYEFRVEGEHASVEASIRKIIEELLNQADLSLFDQQNKVG